MRRACRPGAKLGNATLKMAEAGAGTMVLKAEECHFGYDGKPIIRDFDARSSGATRSASSGPTAPARRRCSAAAGQARRRRRHGPTGHATLQIAYFDQLRQQLDEDRPS